MKHMINSSEQVSPTHSWCISLGYPGPSPWESLSNGRVSPQRGSAFWFFTLDDVGGFDGSSWHGGAAVAGDLGMPSGNGRGGVLAKWIGSHQQLPNLINSKIKDVKGST